MTPEQLLKKRYKVIADYFYNPYKIGDIITVEYEDRSVLLTETSYRDEWGEIVKQANYFHPNTLNDFPHLFKPLQWHEDRSPEDMPQYLRLTEKNYLTTIIIDIGTVVKVLKHFSCSNGEPNERGCQVFGNDFLPYFKSIPATREEYESYLKEKEGEG